MASPNKSIALRCAQGTQPWLTAEDYPVLVDGFPQDDDLDRVAVREGLITAAEAHARSIAEPSCWCRRCYLHDDPANCEVA